MKNKKLSGLILSKKILQARHDHFLQVSDLSGLSGLTDVQIQALEEGFNKDNCFVDDAHAVDCVKRVANCLGFSKNYFLGKEEEIKYESKKYSIKDSSELLVYDSNNKKKLIITPIMQLNILSNFDFSTLIKKMKNSRNTQFNFFLGFFPNSPTLMAPILMTVIAVLFILINLI